MGLSELVSRLQKYQELLTDFTQAQLLQGLGRGKAKCDLRLLFLTLTSQMFEYIMFHKQVMLNFEIDSNEELLLKGGSWI